MRLLRVGNPGCEVPAVMDQDGRRRLVQAFTADFTPGFLELDGIAGLRRWFALNERRCAILPDDLRVGVPVAGIPYVCCVGLNYADHAAESGSPVPAEPVLFTKPSTALCGPDDDVWLPPEATALDYEVELGVILAKTCTRVREADAAACIAGYTIVNDVSERRWQKDRGGGQWTKGKGHARWCPTGPWLVTPDELGDAGALALELDVNQAARQRGSTAAMVFPPARIIAAASLHLTLPAGTLIPTGTPPGVAMGMKPPVWLAAGDRIDLRISGLGTQRQRVVAG